MAEATMPTEAPPVYQQIGKCTGRGQEKALHRKDSPLQQCGNPHCICALGCDDADCQLCYPTDVDRLLPSKARQIMKSSSSGRLAMKFGSSGSLRLQSSGGLARGASSSSLASSRGSPVAGGMAPNSGPQPAIGSATATQGRPAGPGDPRQPSSSRDSPSGDSPSAGRRSRPQALERAVSGASEASTGRSIGATPLQSTTSGGGSPRSRQESPRSDIRTSQSTTRSGSGEAPAAARRASARARAGRGTKPPYAPDGVRKCTGTTEKWGGCRINPVYQCGDRSCPCFKGCRQLDCRTCSAVAPSAPDRGQGDTSPGVSSFRYPSTSGSSDGGGSTRRASSDGGSEEGVPGSHVGSQTYSPHRSSRVGPTSRREGAVTGGGASRRGVAARGASSTAAEGMGRLSLGKSKEEKPKRWR